MQIRSRLMSGQWFSHLPAPFQDSLLAAARERRLTAGQRLFQRGDAPCGLYAVLDGAVRIGAVCMWLSQLAVDRSQRARGLDI